MTKPLAPERVLTLEDLSAIENEVAIQRSRRKLLTETVEKVRRMVAEKSLFMFDGGDRVKLVQITTALGVSIDGFEYSPQAALNLLSWLHRHETVLIALANKGDK